MNVMLVSPDLMFNQSLTSLLETYGIHTTSFLRTDEAFDVWRNNSEPFDLILLDQHPDSEYTLEVTIDEFRDNDINVPIIVLADNSSYDNLLILLKQKIINSVGLKELGDEAVQDLANEIIRLYSQWKG